MSNYYALKNNSIFNPPPGQSPSEVDFTGSSNVALGNVANIQITGGNSSQVLTTDGIGNLSWATPAATGPTITQIQITDSSYNVIDDTAVSTSGGYIKITGSGFSAGAIVVLGNINATSTTFVSSTVLNVQVPSAVAGTYTVYVVNTNGGTAIGVNGLTYSGTPNWVTGSSLPNGLSGSPISIQLSATGDIPMTYALAAGNTLPTGLTLTSGGLLSGTVTVASQTVYAFTIIATDAEAQDSPRAFTITITNADPYFNLTTLLLAGNGTNNGTNNTFLDGSTNNFTITRNGNTTQGTFSPFSQTGWSNYFDGSGDTLTIADNANLEIGSGDFTFEAWIYLTAYSGTYGGSFYNSGICGKDNETTRSYTFGVIAPNTSSYTALSVGLFTGATFVGTQANYNFQLNRWYHVAGARQSGTIRLFVDGILIGSGTNTTSTNNGSQPFCVGAGSLYTGYEYFFPGYISNFRFVNGTAVYTSNFTPSTTPLTAIANTSVLTCQSNRFIDNSTNNFPVTKNGNVSVQSFSPFAPTEGYSTSTVGGSGYFDGTGDWLSFGAQSAFDCGTSTQFCMETWVYPPTSYPNGIHFWSAHQAAVSDGFYFTSNGLYVYSGGGAGGGVTTNKTPIIGAWNHCVLTRDAGGRLRYFLNGELTGTSTTSVQVNTDGKAVGINGGVNFTGDAGYQSQSRYIKGSIPTTYQTSSTAVNTPIFTPPTAPLTTTSQGAVAANVIALVNYTNGQIIDSTSKNLLETIADAKISTVQSKWGGSSIYLDGTGDYLVLPNSNSLDLGTGDFTIEAWVYPINLANSPMLYQRANAASGANIGWFLQIASNTIYFGAGTNSGHYGTFSTTLTTNSWQHIAVTRIGSSLRVFVNGTATAAQTVTNANLNQDKAVSANIGNWVAAGFDLNAYIQDFRITRGYARYTGNFTPPTGAFPTL